MTVVGGGRGPARERTLLVELAAAMAAACWVLLFPRLAEAVEWLEPRREMLSSTATSLMSAMMAETRQVMTLEAQRQGMM